MSFVSRSLHAPLKSFFVDHEIFSFSISGKKYKSSKKRELFQKIAKND